MLAFDRQVCAYLVYADELRELAKEIGDRNMDLASKYLESARQYDLEAEALMRSKRAGSAQTARA